MALNIKNGNSAFQLDTLSGGFIINISEYFLIILAAIGLWYEMVNGMEINTNKQIFVFHVLKGGKLQSSDPFVPLPNHFQININM